MPARVAKWNSDTQFNYGSPTLSGVVVSGTGDSAYITLQSYDNEQSSVSFNDTDFTYSPTQITVEESQASLYITSGGSQTWNLTSSGSYIYDSSDISVSAGVAYLCGVGDVHAQWKLDSVSGTVAYDSSDNSRDGTLQNMEDADWQSGKLGNCLQFDGTNEFINLSASTCSFNLDDAFSVSFWMKSSVTGTLMSVICKQTASYIGWMAYVDSSDTVRFVLQASSLYRLIASCAAAANDGNWHHWVITYDGSSSIDGVTFYRDDQVIPTLNIQNTVAGSITNAATCNIGARNSSSIYFSGYLDEISVYEKELSSTEVAYLWNSGSGIDVVSYSSDHPTVTPKNGFSFSSDLVQFSATETKPGSTGIRYQVSIDDGTTWKWWSGATWSTITSSQTNTWYYNNESNTSSEINTNIGSIGSSGTFKFKAFLHTDGSNTPELDSITVSSTIEYVTGSYIIEMNNDIQPDIVAQWSNFTSTSSEPTNTSVRYQYSIDSGNTYNNTWLTSAELSDVLPSISVDADGLDKLRLKFQLSSSDSTATPTVGPVYVSFWPGVYTSGTYISTAYGPRTATSWDGNNIGISVGSITFDTTVPNGTGVSIRARAVDSTLEDGYTSYNSGDTIGICGYMIQFEAVLTTTDMSVIPRLNWLEVDFHTSIGILRILDQIQTGRARIDTSNNRLIVYEDDAVTPLVEFDLKDGDGQPSSTNVFERVPV